MPPALAKTTLTASPGCIHPPPRYRRARLEHRKILLSPLRSYSLRPTADRNRRTHQHHRTKLSCNGEQRYVAANDCSITAVADIACVALPCKMISGSPASVRQCVRYESGWECRHTLCTPDRRRGVSRVCASIGLLTDCSRQGPHAGQRFSSLRRSTLHHV